jgi:IPT/TIG domain-containing protein
MDWEEDGNRKDGIHMTTQAAKTELRYTCRRLRCIAAIVFAASACANPPPVPDGGAPGRPAAHPTVMRKQDATPGGGDAPLAPLASASDLSYGGGAVLPNVRVVPVFWNRNVNAAVQSEIHCFYTATVSGSYMDWLSEYDTPSQHIGRGSVASDVTLAPGHTGRTLSDGDIRDELAAQIDRGVLPAPTASTLYMVYFPPGVTISSQGGSCVKFCAYHFNFSHNGHQVRYGVVPDFGPGSGCDNGCGTGAQFQNVTMASSHELIEAVTDADPFSAWVGPASEIGDVCNQQPATLPGTSYIVQRQWSNARAACFSPATGPTFTDPPVIASISPVEGPYTMAQQVTMTGNCFANPTVSLGIGGPSAPVTAASPTQLTVSLPSAPGNLPGRTDLFVANSDGAGPDATTYTYLPSGMLSIAPDHGPMQGSTQVTLQGDGLAAGTVTFGGVAATGVSCTSSTSCTAFAPPHDPGPVDVRLAFGGVSELSQNQFTYDGPEITSVSPSSGPITGGTQIVVHGVRMADTSENAFSATAKIGSVSIGSVGCGRQGLFDASCNMVTPALSALPASPVDIQITVTHVTGTHVTTKITAADQFRYTQQPALVDLNFTGNAIGGATVTGTVVLDGFAPAGGALVSLALATGSPAGVISFPASVAIAAGARSANVSILVVGQTFTGDVAITARYAGTTVSGTLAVQPTLPPVLGGVSQLCGGQTITDTVTLREPASPGGGTVLLHADSAIATVPASVTIAAGATSATFSLAVTQPTATQTVHLSATYFGMPSNTVTFTVLPGAAVRLALSPASVVGPSPSTATVTLCTAAPAPGAAVTLASNSAAASVPASVTVPTGSTTASATVSTTVVTAQRTATITAGYRGASAAASLTIKTRAPVCTPPAQLCTCSSGATGCFTTSQQCFNFCAGH